jgi:hypothetical protein
MGTGGAPTPPECLDANQTRGRRASSRLYARLAKRPFSGRGGAESKGGLEDGDKFGTISNRVRQGNKRFIEKGEGASVNFSIPVLCVSRFLLFFSLP